jgi:hypothetical protein
VRCRALGGSTNAIVGPANDHADFQPSVRRRDARNKAAAELAIRQLDLDMVIDIIRPSVVRDHAELLKSAVKADRYRHCRAGYRQAGIPGLGEEWYTDCQR